MSKPVAELLVLCKVISLPCLEFTWASFQSTRPMGLRGPVGPKWGCGRASRAESHKRKEVCFGALPPCGLSRARSSHALIAEPLTSAECWQAKRGHCVRNARSWVRGKNSSKQSLVCRRSGMAQERTIHQPARASGGLFINPTWGATPQAAAPKKEVSMRCPGWRFGWGVAV